jgi:TM2 domain-containing membrane protein YozV
MGWTVTIERPFDLAKTSWEGFDERPTTAKYCRQERTAMLPAFFLGSLGMDQFYAHHWPLAVFKLLTLGAGGIWWFVDVVLWMVSGVEARLDVRAGASIPGSTNERPGQENAVLMVCAESCHAGRFLAGAKYLGISYDLRRGGATFAVLPSRLSIVIA